MNNASQTVLSGSSIQPLFRNVLQVVACLLIMQMPLLAADQNPPDSTKPNVAVAELFTSHGCSSCPPADKVFATIIREHPDVVALEYHVDYWDSLVHGSDGSFKDPFSNPDYTLRQQAYNSQNRYMQGRPGVYTPQMVVNGAYATVGSRKQFVDHAVLNHKERAYSLQVSAKPLAADTDGKQVLSVTTTAPADALDPDAQAWLAIFHIEKVTPITGGENNRKTLTNHHIVTDLIPIGRTIREIRKRDAVAGADNNASPLLLADQVEVTLEEGQGCAVIVQNELPGPVFAAGYCDAAIWR